MLIREVIQNNFASCTVLTIARRLVNMVAIFVKGLHLHLILLIHYYRQILPYQRTIMDSDKLLVLSEGRVVEFDSPKQLVHNTEGYFYKLVRQNGDDTINKLQEMAGPWEAEDKPDNSTDNANSEPSQSPVTSTLLSGIPTRQKTPDHLLNLTDTESQQPQHVNPAHAPHHMPRSLEEVFHRPEGGGASGSMSSA